MTHSDTPAPYLNQLHHGDALAVMATLPEKSVDLIFADPPYNLQLQQALWRPNHTQVDAVDDEWDQFEDFNAYDAFTRQWLTAARRVMNDNATIWISGTYHNIFRVGTLLQDLDFWILNTITWFKTNAMPNFRGTRLKNDVEFVIWAKKSATSGYTFHHHQMKQFNDFSPGKQLGSVWKIPACGGEERLKDGDGKKLHPTQKPEELLKRIIVASSSPGDVVLDPFSGTGTTAVVAKHLHRQWIGIEQDETYLAAAQERIDQTQPLDPDDPLIQDSLEAKPARIPFKQLIEDGYLQPDQELYLDTPEHAAVIQADGLIHANGFTGSIHRVGAQLKNAPSCNGWLHWKYFDQKTGTHQLLDVLRERIRAQNAE
jgi:modification methylase